MIEPIEVSLTDGSAISVRLSQWTTLRASPIIADLDDGGFVSRRTLLLQGDSPSKLLCVIVQNAATSESQVRLRGYGKVISREADWRSALEVVKLKFGIAAPPFSDTYVRRLLLSAIGIAIGTSLLWFLVGYLPYWLSRDLDVASKWGDTFGVVNALFSGLALGGVIAAVVLQTLELRYQRQELQESQEQWRRTAEAQEKSNRVNDTIAKDKATFELIMMLQSDDVRRARAAIHQGPINCPSALLAEKESERDFNRSTVIAAFGTAGNLIKMEKVHEDVILESYCVSILRAFLHCSPLIGNRRKDNGPYYWKGFTDIVGLCLKRKEADWIQDIDDIRARYDGVMKRQQDMIDEFNTLPT